MPPALGFRRGDRLRYQPQILDDYPAVPYALGVMRFANLFWNLLNLVPCLPLDGGNIMAALVYRFIRRRPQQRVMQISILASGGVALLAAMYAPWMRMLIIFFGILCAQHVIAYNDMRRY